VTALQGMEALRALGQKPAAALVEEALQAQEEGTLAFCREQGLPVADWQTELAAMGG
jgi:hypothetical protein